MKLSRLTIIVCFFYAFQFLTGCSKKEETPTPTVITSVTPTSAAGGDTITITGSNFSGLPSDNIVKLNGNVVAVVKASTTQLSFILPSGFSTGSISVSVTAYAQTGSYAYAYTKLPLVITFAGSGVAGYADGTGTAAVFQSPTGMVFDNTGNLFVCDQLNHRIRKITAGGVVTTFAGNGTKGYADGAATAAMFNAPGDLVFDAAGNLYVGDELNGRIRKITPAGVVSTFAGSGFGTADGPATTAQFGNPRGMAFDAAGNLYVADAQLYKIRKITPAGVVSTFAGSGVKGSTNGTGTAAQFIAPIGLAIDAAGNLYVADGEGNTIRKITPAGVVTTLAGSGTAGSVDGTGTAAQLSSPGALCIDPQGNLFVAESFAVKKVTSAGVVTTIAGSGKMGFQNGNSAIASFSYISGIAVDFSGTIFLGDLGNQRVRRIFL